MSFYTVETSLQHFNNSSPTSAGKSRFSKVYDLLRADVSLELQRRLDAWQQCVPVATALQGLVRKPFLRATLTSALSRGASSPFHAACTREDWEPSDYRHSPILFL